AVERLTGSVKDLSVEVDAATRMPVSIQSRAAGARLSAAAESPETAIKQFVKDGADLWNLADADADTLEVHSVSRQGLPTVRLVQRIDGVEVFQGELKGALDSDNQLVSVTGQVFSGAAAASSRQAVARRARAVTTTPEAAIAKAATDLTGVAYAAKD